jgi:hypothetical protein
VPFMARRDTAPAYWVFGVLWVVLAESEQTGGAFSVMEQWMPADGGPRSRGKIGTKHYYW